MCVKAPIDYAFPVRSMQQVYSKLHTEAAPLKNARIWRVPISDTLIPTIIGTPISKLHFI